LQKASEGGRVEPGLVGVQVQGAQQLLTGVAEADTGSLIGFTIRTVRVDRGTGPGAVGGGNNAALVVAIQPGFIGGAARCLRTKLKAGRRRGRARNA